MRTATLALAAVLVVPLWGCGGGGEEPDGGMPDAITVPDQIVSDTVRPDSTPPPDTPPPLDMPRPDLPADTLPPEDMPAPDLPADGPADMPEDQKMLPDGPPPDVPVPTDFDFTCSGQPLPTTASDPVGVSGFMLDFVTLTPLEGAMAEARLRSNDMIIDTTTTAADGTFSLSVENPGRTPVDAYVQFTLNGYATTYLYPSEPVFNVLTGVQAGMVMAEQANAIYQVAGAGQYDPARGTLVVVIVDCSANPIVGATVSISPSAGAIGYVGAGGVPSTSATGTDATGFAIAFNTPPGVVTAGGRYQGFPLRSHTVDVRADALTITIVHP